MKIQTPLIEKRGLKQLIQLDKPFTFNTSKTLSLKVYPDSRPKILEIASLQKGLVLLANGLELIEEGAGFGVPVLKYSDMTFFSRTATVWFKEQDKKTALIMKVFSLDSVSKKQVRGAFINDGLYSVFHKTFENAYLRHGKLRSIFDWIMRLRRRLGIETHFAKVTPRGKVTVYYHCFPDQITVIADFSEVDMTSLQEILILNEQGATFFRKNRKGNLVLQDKKIGAWIRVNTKHAEFSDLEEHFSFSMENKNGTILYCGWEQVKDSLSWAGMTYALSPRTSLFTYTIQLKENLIPKPLRNKSVCGLLSSDNK